MSCVTVSVRLYGELSCYGRSIDHARNYATIQVSLPRGSKLKDLMEYLLMCTNERGFTFINGKMSAMPNTQPDLGHELQNGDQVLFFPLRMLPTGLDFEMKMTDRMTRTLRADEDLNLYYLYE